MPVGLCTRLNREDSAEATQTQNDNTAGRSADFIVKFVKGFRYAQIRFCRRIQRFHVYETRYDGRQSACGCLGFCRTLVLSKGRDKF